MPEPIVITLTSAELRAAEDLKITPEDYLAAKRVDLARNNGLERGGLGAEGDGIPRADYEAIDDLHRRGRVNINDYHAATGRDEHGRKIGDPR